MTEPQRLLAALDPSDEELLSDLDAVAREAFLLIIARAKWIKIGPQAMGSVWVWHLKARKQDGGAVLAEIREYNYGAGWTAGEQRGMTRGLYGAQRAVRKALREGNAS